MREYGFTRVYVEDGAWVRCYSAEELQARLRQVLKHQTLLRCMVELYGFLNIQRLRENLLDLTYTGGRLLMIFDKIMLELDVLVEGAVAYRVIKPWNVKMLPTFGEIPEDFDTNHIYFCDLKESYPLDYDGCTVCDVSVERTDTYGFDPYGFDLGALTRAAEDDDLPSALSFSLDNGKTLRVIADYMEYYLLELQ